MGRSSTWLITITSSRDPCSKALVHRPIFRRPTTPQSAHTAPVRPVAIPTSSSSTISSSSPCPCRNRCSTSTSMGSICRRRSPHTTCRSRHNSRRAFTATTGRRTITVTTRHMAELHSIGAAWCTTITGSPPTTSTCMSHRRSLKLISIRSAGLGLTPQQPPLMNNSNRSSLPWWMWMPGRRSSTKSRSRPGWTGRPRVREPRVLAALCCTRTVEEEVVAVVVASYSTCFRYRPRHSMANGRLVDPMACSASSRWPTCETIARPRHHKTWECPWVCQCSKRTWWHRRVFALSVTRRMLMSWSGTSSNLCSRRTSPTLYTNSSSSTNTNSNFSSNNGCRGTADEVAARRIMTAGRWSPTSWTSPAAISPIAYPRHPVPPSKPTASRIPEPWQLLPVARTSRPRRVSTSPSTMSSPNDPSHLCAPSDRLKRSLHQEVGTASITRRPWNVNR